MSLETTWFHLISKYSEDPVLQQHLWKEILTAYQERERFYHNLNHILYLVNLTKDYKADIEDMDSLLFSIFYHDIIYQIPGENNEIESAEFTKKRLKLFNYPEKKISKCCQQIKATKYHQNQENLDAMILIDMDLAILGESQKNYQQYAENIRKEYAIYPDSIYQPERSKLLQKLLTKNPLYQTQGFQERFETRARTNLTWELEQLNRN